MARQCHLRETHRRKTRSPPRPRSAVNRTRTPATDNWLLERSAEEREGLDEQMRLKLATLYELLPHAEKVSKKDVQAKLDAAGFEELLPYWRKVIGNGLPQRRGTLESG